MTGVIERNDRHWPGAGWGFESASCCGVTVSRGYPDIAPYTHIYMKGTREQAIFVGSGEYEESLCGIGGHISSSQSNGCGVGSMVIKSIAMNLIFFVASRY